MTITQEQPTTTQAVRTGIIDCDLHPMPRGLDENCAACVSGGQR
jgi:hypothetical protein